MIAIENSTWNNIGDAFYQKSIENIFIKIFGVDNIVSFDGPYKRAFRPRKFEKNGFDSRSLVNAEHYIFSGPILGDGFFEEYAPLIEKICNEGKSYSLISMHAYATGELLQRFKTFFEIYPPRFFHSRDSYTYRKFEECKFEKMDGICFAFFVSMLNNVPEFSQEEKYIAISYHSKPEPVIERIDSKYKNQFLYMPTIENSSYINWKYLRHFDFLKKYPKEIEGVKIIRPVHSFYPSPHLLFSRPNTYISYNPVNFLAVYKYCNLVITDRVHAAVAAISYGNPAFVERLDNRFELFSRGPVVSRNGFYYLDEEKLVNEYQKVEAWIVRMYGDLKN